MRASREIPVSIALEGRLAETSVLLASETARQQNTAVLQTLVKGASAIRAPEPHALGWLWRGVPSSLAKAVVGGFPSSRVHFSPTGSRFSNTSLGSRMTKSRRPSTCCYGPRATAVSP